MELKPVTREVEPELKKVEQKSEDLWLHYSSDFATTEQRAEAKKLRGEKVLKPVIAKTQTRALTSFASKDAG